MVVVSFVFVCVLCSFTYLLCLLEAEEEDAPARLGVDEEGSLSFIFWGEGVL